MGLREQLFSNVREDPKRVIQHRAVSFDEELVKLWLMGQHPGERRRIGQEGSEIAPRVGPKHKMHVLRAEALKLSSCVRLSQRDLLRLKQGTLQSTLPFTTTSPP